jgi:arylsulfatase A-like enzyme
MTVNTTSKPNILFILIDGLRADKIYGLNKSSKTPNIDSLIKNSVYFTQAVSSVDGTFLSLNCILNSVYPFKTGIRAKKIILTENNFFKYLKDFHYHIYGLIPDLISFQPLTKFFENDDATYNGTPPVEHLHDGLGNKIITLLDSTLSEPWFYYLHILDLHYPHIVPNSFKDKNFGNGDYEQIISSIDVWVGHILNKVDLKNTLIVLTSDHGMNVPIDNKTITDFEPDLATGLKIGKRIMPKLTHKIGAKLFILLKKIMRDIRLVKANRNLNSYEIRSRLPYFTLSLFDENIRVPLLFGGIGLNPKIINQQTRSIDIFPTIAQIINMQIKKDLIHGASLVPLIQGQSLPEMPIYLHTMPYEEISSDDKVGIRTSNYKYFRSSHNKEQQIHLYDLIKDPLENQNLSESNYKIINEMEKLLSEISSDSLTTNQNNDDEETKKIQEELKKLGYL